MKPQYRYKPVSEQLMAWYAEHKRMMPWRGEHEPYLIWLSEVILQQTRVEQGKPYYERFVSLFPTVSALAKAEEQSVLKAWEGLGYYSRARNLHRSAKLVVGEMNGVFPKTYAGLLALPGVGEYTAAAIASICYGEKVVVIDGNVNRFISRYYGIKEPIGSSIGRKLIREHAQRLLEDSISAGDFNQALMEFGSLQCVPKSPDCTVCPLSDGCSALRDDLVGSLPVKKKSKASRDRFFLYRVPIDDGHTYIQKRGLDDIWKGLYEFSLLEMKAGLQDVKNTEPVLIDENVKHVLSHQTIHARFIVYEGSPRYGEESLERVTLEELSDYPLSRLSTRFMEKTPHIWNSKQE